ncbi:protein disulfide-isomerase [Plakobranchus ocellatus]|uniref:Protein disulfide-isomerase n=1 Tax=Plakobranchus ocellatus TaxID=259542 RepID=A0AAV3YJ64_9GAST|nr:protein disulfide-isomerase [Plakobranchus ocellatus]
MGFSHFPGYGKLPILSELDVHREFLTNQEELLCSVVKEEGTIDEFEDNVSELSQLHRFRKNIAGVIKISHNHKECNASDHECKEAHKVPFLRCFLGPGFTSEITGPQSFRDMSKWLISLKKKIKHMWQDDINHLEALRKKKNVVLLGLPTLAQLPLLDLIAKAVKTSLSKSFSVGLILIHPDSKNASPLRVYLDLPLQASLLAVYGSLGNQEMEKKIFKGKDINAKKISVESFAHFSGVKHLNVGSFEWEAMTVKRSERFRPYLVVFYAWWAEHVESYLRLIKLSIEEMQTLNILAKFALVNVAEEKTVMSRYVDVKHFKSVPFIAVFQREKGKDSVNQTLVYESHPSPYFLFRALRAHGVWLHDIYGKLWDYAPYATLNFKQFSDLREGPRGTVCTAWASNLTDSMLPRPMMSKKPRARTKLPPRLERQLSNLDGVPILTEAFWDAAIERSQTMPGSFQLEPDVHVTMLVFIRDGCGSCNQKMHTFKQVYQELSKKGNTHMYLLNCSNDADLCNDLGVQGYPTVSALRNFAALATPKCTVNPPEKPYIRRDYHGPLSTGDLISWIESLAKSGISYNGFEVIKKPSDMVEDVRLVATVIPKYSNYLPLAPRGDRNYFYHPQCLRLVCERLYGLASCHIIFSREIPAGEFSKTPARGSGMVVTKVTFERRDGVSVNLMRLGKSMHKLIEEETSSDLHLFHNPHQYSLHPKQTCEEDHDVCTQTLVAFVRDHLRLPVTQLTSEIFHTKNNPIFGDGKLLLIALSQAQNITHTSRFMKLLETVAKTLYHEVIVTVLDADQFPAWAGSFVPQFYSNLYIDSADGGPLHIYPRVCLVTWQDHKQAAFYPPLPTLFNTTILRQLKLVESDDIPADISASFKEEEDVPNHSIYEDGDIPATMDAASTTHWDEEKLVNFVKAVLAKPEHYFVRTEHF